jgi:predicted negative regulator of RcsB-dependent stress response
VSFVILNGNHFVTIITLIVSAYFGANVWQKHVLKKNASIKLSASTEATIENRNNEEGEA